jgi:hypothetical protein
VKDVYGRADAEVLTAVERAAHNGRRITARRARRQKKRANQAGRGWSLGPLTISPAVAVVVGIVVLLGVAGAAAAVGGGHESHSKSAARKPSSSGARRSGSVTSSTRSGSSVPAVKGVYVRFADVGGTAHYMWCTRATGCALVDVAKNGSSTVVASLAGGVWHRVERNVIEHDPCINIIQNGARIGRPGDLVMVRTTDLHPAGTQTIKGVAVPARVAGTIAVHTEHPDVPDCTFSGTPDFTQGVNSPVTELSTGKARG